MSKGRIILGVLAGLTAGTLIGIFFAPDKGSSTRKKIIDKGEDYVENLKGRINSLMHNGSKLKEKVKVSV